MQALALIEAPGHVCYRYRIAAFRDWLAAVGVRLEAMPLGRGLIRRLRALRAARRTDVVILQRKLLPLWQLRLLRKWSRRLVYDVDDAVFQRDSYCTRPPESWQRLAAYWATAHTADAVIAGNEFLRQRTAEYIDPSRVHLIPTCVDPARYPLAAHTREDSIRLTWIGQRSTLPSLSLAGPRLASASRMVSGLELHVVADAFPDLPEVTVVPHHWSEDSECRLLAEADIGISWLPDDGWSRGKCGLKVLQYMAAGLPVLANPVGCHYDMVLDGETGFLVRTPVEWAAAVRRLSNDPPLRRAMGRAGRHRVEQHYSVDQWGSRFASIVANLPIAGTIPARTAPSDPLPSSAESGLPERKAA
ncbi:MAG: glycosyltransferase family 4 protein [Thermoguttaceae bacterium]|nr:glycosyltransferase family 4 protein [Thermoguttaceae bacterium]